MSSTATVLDSVLTSDRPIPLSLPLDPIAPQDPLALVPNLPSLSNVLFPDFSLSPSDPTVTPSEGAEAPAAAPFTITDISSASWAAAKVLECQARIAQRTELARAYIEKINSWLSSSCKADESSSDYLTTLLKPYIEAELSRSHSRSRSLSLLTATASLRKGQDRVEILDEAAAIAYCESSCPSAVVIKKELSRSALRRLILTDGTPIPGVEASIGFDTLHIRPRD